MISEADLRAEVERLSAELRHARAQSEDEHRRLVTAQAELVNSAKLATLGSLIAGIAHELNTPLGSLNSNHDVLRRALGRLQIILEDEHVDQTELAELRRVVRALDGVMKVNDLAVERMVKLVKSLRSFGRPDQSERDTVDLHDGLESTLALVSHQLRGRIQVNRVYGELPKVDCFPNQLNQVWMNLLVNAGHAISGDGTISVRTRAETEGVAVEIEDTGSGIPPENLNRIFEPGFTTKDGRIGMGLGLLIVRQVVERHGGRIAVRSQLGTGSCFTVQLPLQLPSNPGRST
ncbi:MAG: ATP-binding protein [Gemmatimonadota bacterium]